MSLRLPRLALAAATLPLVLAAAAGCGSGDDSSSTDSSSSSSPSDSPSASSSASTSETTVPETDAGHVDGESVEPSEFMEIYTSAFEDATSVHLTMKSGGAGGMDAEGDADYSTTPPTTSLRMRSDQLDPRTMFDTFEKGITSVTYVGEEDVEGEPVSITAPPADQITTMPGM